MIQPRSPINFGLGLGRVLEPLSIDSSVRRKPVRSVWTTNGLCFRIDLITEVVETISSVFGPIVVIKRPR